MLQEKLSSHRTGAYKKAGFYSSFSRGGREEKGGHLSLMVNVAKLDWEGGPS